MADRAISELVSANQVAPTDYFVLEQEGIAKKLTGLALEEWFASLYEAHGGVLSFEKFDTNGLQDTYRITLADRTTFDFVVTNGANGADGYTPQKGIDYVDGKDGYTPQKGVDYFDGYTPVKGKDYFDGERGEPGYTPQKGVDYTDGKDGVSATHIWNGTVLTVTSASGTSSADLKGERGDSGVVAHINGFFTLSVDADGNLYAYCEDEAVPEFEYDPDTGNLYVVQEES